MNIGWDLAEIARQMPDRTAVVEAVTRDQNGKWRYRSVTYQELDRESSNIAGGLQELGVTQGTRMALLVKPGVDFVTLVFALFKSGAVTILIDPGMGREHLVNCLSEAKPQGFVAISKVHAVRVLKRSRFPAAKLNVTLGRRWFWGGKTVNQLRAAPSASPPDHTNGDDPAAIIFTTGSTGPPKGVLYRHGNFAHQVQQIRDQYDIRPGDIDLAGFPLFGLFNSAMGGTTVFPKMDFTRPADVNPDFFLQHARDWSPTQSFGSPALWNTVGRHCEKNGARFETIRRVFSAGAPVPPHVLRRVVAAIGEGGEVHTPYGATEALPVATISSLEILGETAEKSEAGAGTCVGRPFDGIAWRVIRITDDPLADINKAEPLPPGEIGELIVCGPVVTTEYVTRTEMNALAKVQDDGRIWHRMGDCGYLDEENRFWFCGRKSHRVVTAKGTMFTVPCEAIANAHPKVYRSALVGLGTGMQRTPAVILELWPEHQNQNLALQETLLNEVHDRLQASELTQDILRQHLLMHPGFPVDIRHNAKIFREKLAPWANAKLRGRQ